MKDFFMHATDLSHPGGILGLSLLGFLLCRIPYAGKWFRGFDTLFHETGHALTAMVLGGEAHSIDLNADTSGKTVFSSKGKWRNWLVYVSGYPFSSVCGCLLYVMISFGHSAAALLFTLSIILLNLALWIRNAYGWAWVLVNGAGILLVFYYHWVFWQQALAILIASWVSLDAFYSCWVLILLNTKKPEGDAGELKKITHIPGLLYALGFMLFSLLCLVISFCVVSGSFYDLLRFCGIR